MAYIPEEHVRYDVLPHYREKGGKVFSYDAETDKPNEVRRTQI